MSAPPLDVHHAGNKRRQADETSADRSIRARCGSSGDEEKESSMEFVSHEEDATVQVEISKSPSCDVTRVWGASPTVSPTHAWVICGFLSNADCARFAHVCKHWKRAMETMHYLKLRVEVYDQVHAMWLAMDRPSVMHRHVRHVRFCESALSEEQMCHITRMFPRLETLECRLRITLRNASPIFLFPPTLKTCDLHITGPQIYLHREQVKAVLHNLAPCSTTLETLRLAIRRPFHDYTKEHPLNTVDFSGLLPLSKLKEFSFEWTGPHCDSKFIPSSLLVVLAAVMPQLTDLCLFDGEISAATMMTIANGVGTNLPLCTLRLYASVLTDELAACLQTTFPHLTTLDPFFIKTQNLDFLQTFPRCTTLECIQPMSTHGGFHADTLERGLMVAPQLTRLAIGSYPTLLDAHMERILAALPVLTGLSIQNCSALRTLRWLSKCGPRLRDFTLDGSMIPLDSVNLRFLVLCTRLETLHFRYHVTGICDATRALLTPPTTLLPSLQMVKW